MTWGSQPPVIQENPKTSVPDMKVISYSHKVQLGPRREEKTGSQLMW